MQILAERLNAIVASTAADERCICRDGWPKPGYVIAAATPRNRAERRAQNKRKLPAPVKVPETHSPECEAHRGRR